MTSSTASTFMPGVHPLGFIGTGVMGASMVANLLAKGWQVHVFSRTRSKADGIVAKGAVWHDRIATVAATCPVVMTMVGYPRDVEAVYSGSDGVLTHALANAVLIDFTTSDPRLARTLAESAVTRGMQMLDAPVTGGDIGAQKGTLSILVGGDATALARVQPILAAVGRTITHLGGPGCGQHGKLANQIAIAGMMLGVCESLVYARAAGLDPHTLLGAIQNGAAASWAMTNLAPRMIVGDNAPGFFIKHFIKDLELAASAGLDLPGLATTLAQYRRIAATHGERGTQALMAAYSTVV